MAAGLMKEGRRGSVLQECSSAVQQSAVWRSSCMHAQVSLGSGLLLQAGSARRNPRCYS